MPRPVARPGRDERAVLRMCFRCAAQPSRAGPCSSCRRARTAARSAKREQCRAQATAQRTQVCKPESEWPLP